VGEWKPKRRSVKERQSERKAPPRPAKQSDLEFEPQGMVPWLNPRFLVRAGIEVALSDLFARFADKREVEAGLPTETPPTSPRRLTFRRSDAADVEPYTDESYRDDDGALWFDYAADVGEGFDPTYTVAWLLAQPTLVLDSGGQAHPTERGKFLILGGDQVYPSASWEAYRDRFVGPYRAALPFVPAEEDAPHLYAIPGNHDWYDGLTSFMRLFCQGSWIGGWRTRQRRSYFALRLSEHWWFWATDIQFDTYMDGPQLDYFRQKSDELESGHRVILATAKPSWVSADPEEETRIKQEGSWETLSFVEEQLIASSGAEVAVTISGDKHHYVRYTRTGPGNPQERITAGGGGAHTSATHGLEDTLELRTPASKAINAYERRGISPTPEESLRMRRAALWGIARAWPLGVLIGAIYAVLAILLAAGIKDNATGLEASLFEHQGAGQETERSIGELFWDSITIWNVALAVLLFVGLKSFAGVHRGKRLSRRLKRWLFALLHWLAHIVPAVGLTLLGLWLLNGWRDPGRDGLALGWIVAGGMFVVGFTLGRVVFALYLWLANRNDARQHATEIYGGLASTEYKNFLRLRLGRDGALTIYPIGIPTSSAWRLASEAAADSDPWFVPKDHGHPRPGLIEPAIRIPPG